MKNKKLILFLIILFPSLFWLTLELSTINSSKLPYYGPKTLDGKDTVYHTVQHSGFDNDMLNDTVRFPLYVIAFIKDSHKPDPAHLSGLIEYLKYKQENIRHVPIIWAEGYEEDTTLTVFKAEPVSVKKQLGITNDNVYELGFNVSGYDKLVKNNYFDQKPYYVGESYLVLIDKYRHIRGYYDGQFVAEVKRLIDEYKHIRLKEEQKNLINTNKIEKSK